ncbi:MAG: hypothetical protein ACR2FM_05760 [Candidatus Saccharimonadales bacterium]
MRSIRKLWERRRSTTIIILITVVFIAVSGAVIINKRTGESFYFKQLSALESEINQIPPLLEPSDDVKTSLDEYNKQMVRISDRCQKLTDKTDKNIEKPDEKVIKLCGDLTVVTLYSGALYDSLRNYLLLPAQSFSAADSADYRDRLTQTSQVISAATLNLSKIDNSKVKDPALDELKAQVEAAQKVATSSQQSLGQKDYAEALRLSNQLVGLTSQDKQDFLSARSYFWNNTVQIAALQQSVSKLRDQLKNN